MEFVSPLSPHMFLLASEADRHNGGPIEIEAKRNEELLRFQHRYMHLHALYTTLGAQLRTATSSNVSQWTAVRGSCRSQESNFIESF